jgi:hypothetical protein
LNERRFRSRCRRQFHGENNNRIGRATGEWRSYRFRKRKGRTGKRDAERFAGSDDKSNQRVNYESTRAALATLGLTTAA